MIYKITYAMKELSNHDEKRTRTHFINIKQYGKWENCVFFYIKVIGNKSMQTKALDIIY